MSKQFLFPIDQIKIKEGRFRTDFGNIDSLAQSIKEHGLIQPIILDQDNFLVAGERRLTACRKIGLTEVPVAYKEALDEITYRELELEENLHRKDFSWEEEVRAKKEIHELKQRIHGKAIQGSNLSTGWGIKETAEALDQALGTVAEDIQLAEALEIYPELAKEKNKSAAIKKLRNIKRRKKAAEEAAKFKESGEVRGIYHGDSREVLKGMEKESVDLVIADPPFGIGLYDRLQSAGHVNEYEDSDDPVEVKKMCESVFDELYRILKPNSHAYIFFGAEHYQWCYASLILAGFDVDPIPWIWYKGTGGAPTSTQLRGVNAYEPFFHCSKGKRELQGGKPDNVLYYERVPVNQRIHHCEKPVSLLRDLIHRSSNPGEIVLDPFGGSGSTGVAAIMEGRESILIEKSDSSYALICKRLQTMITEEKE